MVRNRALLNQLNDLRNKNQRLLNMLGEVNVNGVNLRVQALQDGLGIQDADNGPNTPASPENNVTPPRQEQLTKTASEMLQLRALLVKINAFLKENPTHKDYFIREVNVPQLYNFIFEVEDNELPIEAFKLMKKANTKIRKKKDIDQTLYDDFEAALEMEVGNAPNPNDIPVQNQGQAPINLEGPPILQPEQGPINVNHANNEQADHVLLVHPNAQHNVHFNQPNVPFVPPNAHFVQPNDHFYPANANFYQPNGQFNQQYGLNDQQNFAQINMDHGQFQDPANALINEPIPQNLNQGQVFHPPNQQQNNAINVDWNAIQNNEQVRDEWLIGELANVANAFDYP